MTPECRERFRGDTGHHFASSIKPIVRDADGSFSRFRLHGRESVDRDIASLALLPEVVDSEPTNFYTRYINAIGFERLPRMPAAAQ